jgi:mRNA-degrading endonuclease RelE of RelBE toxin-antitoxin system
LIRVGDYRVVYAVDDAERLVLVARIAAWSIADDVSGLLVG